MAMAGAVNRSRTVRTKELLLEVASMLIGLIRSESQIVTCNAPYQGRLRPKQIRIKTRIKIKS